MSKRLSIEQKIQQYRQANPKLKNYTDKQILSVMVENGEITLSEAQKISIYSNTQSNVDNQGLTVQKQTKSRTINLKSGRKIVIKEKMVQQNIMPLMVWNLRESILKNRKVKLT